MSEKWIRSGECNHCGHCCQTIAREALVREDGQVNRDREYYVARGFRQATVDGRRQWVLFGWVAAPCPQHVEGRCAMQASKPRTCREFPLVPLDVVGTPCSYWFSNGVVKLGGTGSPHPATEMDLLQWESAHAR